MPAGARALERSGLGLGKHEQHLRIRELPGSRQRPASTDLARHDDGETALKAEVQTFSRECLGCACQLERQDRQLGTGQHES